MAHNGLHTCESVFTVKWNTCQGSNFCAIYDTSGPSIFEAFGSLVTLAHLKRHGARIESNRIETNVFEWNITMAICDSSGWLSQLGVFNLGGKFPMPLVFSFSTLPIHWNCWPVCWVVTGFRLPVSGSCSHQRKLIFGLVRWAEHWLRLLMEMSWLLLRLFRAALNSEGLN